MIEYYLGKKLFEHIIHREENPNTAIGGTHSFWSDGGWLVECFFNQTNDRYCTSDLLHSDLSGNEIQLLLSSLSQLTASTYQRRPLELPVLSLFNQTHLLQIVNSTTDDGSISLLLKPNKLAYMIMVRMTHTITMLSTKVLSQRIDSHTRSHVQVTSNGS